jgi:undecaprenyl diphosphate synthase
LYAFSSDNWSRPRHEVIALMHLFRTHLRAEATDLADNGVRLSVIGRRDRLPPVLRQEIVSAERVTAAGDRLHLRLAIDYSSRDAILRAARALGSDGPWDRETFARALGEAYGPGAHAPDVDLLIRTGGEQRVSDFLLWEAAYAELAFMPHMWPEFGAAALAEAVADFHSRERRFGALPAAG